MDEQARVGRRKWMLSTLGGAVGALGVAGDTVAILEYIVQPLFKMLSSHRRADRVAKDLVLPRGTFSVQAPKIHPDCGRPPVDGQCPVEVAVKIAIADALGEPRIVVPKEVPYRATDSVICIGGPVYNRYSAQVFGTVGKPRFKWTSPSGLESQFEYSFARVSGHSTSRVHFGRKVNTPLNAIVTKSRVVVSPDGRNDYLLVTRLPIRLGEPAADVVILAGVGGAGSAGADTLLFGRRFLDPEAIVPAGAPRHFQAIFRVSKFGIDKEHWTIPEEIELVTGKLGGPRMVTTPFTGRR